MVIDRACVIPEGMVIGEDPQADARRFERSEGGVVLVTREMLEKLEKPASPRGEAATGPTP